MKFCPVCLKENSNDSKFCEGCGQDLGYVVPIYHLAVGTLLNGKYIVGKAIGEGGFGITYIGKDVKLDMLVAIKEYFPNGYVNRSNTLSSALTYSIDTERKSVYEKGLRRFLTEARALGKFAGTEGIVDIRDFFEENNTAYIVMEYLDGQNLKTFLEYNGRLSDKDTIELLMPVMQALQKIHKVGLIHRDISPDNIMLMEGKIKLLDFGAVRDVSGSGNKSMTVTLKHGYAPEEQYREHGAQGAWTDVYALCATMYKCITGIIPEDAMERIVKDEVLWPTEMGVEIHYDFEKVLMKGMSVFAKDRYQNMDDFINAIMSTELFDEINNGNIIHQNRNLQQEEKTLADSSKDIKKDLKKKIEGIPGTGVSNRGLILISLIPAIPLITMIIIMFFIHPVDYDGNIDGNDLSINKGVDEGKNNISTRDITQESIEKNNSLDENDNDNVGTVIDENDKIIRPESIMGITDIENLTYENDYFGIGCSLNSDWEISSSKTITENYGDLGEFDYAFAASKPGCQILIIVSNDNLPELEYSEEKILEYTFGGLGYQSGHELFLESEHSVYCNNRVVEFADASFAATYDKVIAIKKGKNDYMEIYFLSTFQNTIEDMYKYFYIPGKTMIADEIKNEVDDRTSYALLPLSDYASIRVSSEYDDGTSRYSVENLTDIDKTTCWRGSKDKEDYIEITFNRPISISAIEIQNGNLKSEKSYDYYAKAKKLQIEYDGGMVIMPIEEVSYDDTVNLAYHVSFNKDITTKNLRITVLDTYPGRKYNEVCISEIVVLALGRQYLEKEGNEKIYINGNEFKIGSAQDNDYIIDNKSGTSYKAVIKRYNDSVQIIENLGKKKITVDGDLISKGTVHNLREGSIIVIGNDSFVFRTE